MTDKIILHPIAEHGRHLMPRNTDLIDEQLNGLLNVGKSVLDIRAEAISQARKIKGNRDLTKEAIARRQHELFGKDTLAKLHGELQKITRTTQAMREKIAKDARPKGPESDTRALLEYMQRRDLLHDLRELKQEGKGGEIVKLLTRSAQAGDRSVLDALQSSLKPLIDPRMLEAGEEYYLGATQREALENLETQEAIEDAARLAVRQITGKGEGMVKEAERAGDLLPKPLDLKTDSPVASLDDSQKAELIGKVGLEGYKAIKRGEQPLPPAYWPEADKEAFAEEHGGDAWEGFLAGTWTPPAEKTLVAVDPFASLGPPAK